MNPSNDDKFNKPPEYTPIDQKEPTNTMSYPNYPGYSSNQPSYPPAYSPESGQNIDFDNAFSDKGMKL